MQNESTPEYTPVKAAHGCRQPTNIAGTNGGKLPCGSVLRELSGARRRRLCTTCAADDAEWLYGVALPEDAGQTSNATTVYGYDGNGYGVGDRIEIHPGTDLWARGARFGTVVGIRPTPQDQVRVTLDATGARVWSGPADRFRALV